MMERTFADRLRLVMGDEKPTPWAQARGISGTTVHDWLVKGMQPYPKSLAKLVAATGIPSEWWLNGAGDHPLPDQSLMTKDDAPAPADQKIEDVAATSSTYSAWAHNVQMDDFVPVRYYRRVSVSAGHGAANTDHPPAALLFTRQFIVDTLRTSAEMLLLVRVKGDSMYPTLQTGWTVMVDTSKRTIGEGIYVVRLGDMEVCKRLEPRPGGIIRVISDNKVYEEYEINTNTVAENEFDVLGKVVWFAGLVN